jgi:glycosyltransferase involved in cell wall biosynthesis
VGGAVPGHDEVHALLQAALAGVPQLTYHGAVPYHAVNDLFERSRVFVNTSDTEGFPNSYLQAWIRGVPVVAFFDPDGTIAREGLGLVVRNMGEMATAVRQLLEDQARWMEASERCRRFMAAHYDEQSILSPYLEAIRDSA